MGALYGERGGEQAPPITQYARAVVIGYSIPFLAAKPIEPLTTYQRGKQQTHARPGRAFYGKVRRAACRGGAECITWSQPFPRGTIIIWL